MKTKGGFTLVEVMMATAVLALGVVMIYEAFFTSLDAFNYWYHYLNISCWVDEKIWEAQDNISRLGQPSALDTKGNFINQNKNFDWGLSYSIIDEEEGLYAISLSLSWREGQRKVGVSRMAYAMYVKEEKE